MKKKKRDLPEVRESEIRIERKGRERKEKET